MPGVDALVMETDGQGSTLVTYTAHDGMLSQRRSGTTLRQREALSGKRKPRQRRPESPFAFRFALLAFRCLSHGSTRQLAGSNESITDLYHFSAFGNTIASSGSTTNPFLYAGARGYYNDNATGLYRLFATRYYESAVGRLLTLDSVVPAADGYAYARNTPTAITSPVLALKRPPSRPDPAGVPGYPSFGETWQGCYAGPGRGWNISGCWSWLTGEVH